MLIKEWFWSDDSDRMCQDCHSSLIDMRRQPAVPLYDIAASVTLFIGYANAATYNNAKKLQRHDVTQYYMLMMDINLNSKPPSGSAVCFNNSQVRVCSPGSRPSLIVTARPIL